jgi:hypothetical protein
MTVSISVIVLMLAGGAGGFVVGWIWGMEHERKRRAGTETQRGPEGAMR